jgi:hypothetical protein
MTDALEARLTEVERKVDNLVEVCSAVADDTLRVCFILDELHRVGSAPPLPWPVATALVELHHAMQAEKDGMKDAEGVEASQRVVQLKQEVLRLREEYQQSLKRGVASEVRPSG